MVCRGYWRDVGNVEAELRAWMTADGVEGRMPTNMELRASGANSLALAIANYHGGYVAFARRLGCGRKRMPAVPYVHKAWCPE